MTTDLNYGNRLALAHFEDGAAMLDLTTGTFYRLNPVAAQICQHLIEGQLVADVARDVACSFAIPVTIAQRDVEAFLEQLGKRRQPASSNPITFLSNGAGHVLQWYGRPFWHIDCQGRKLTYLADGQGSAPDSTTQLLWALPHVLLLQQRLVLHASAVEHAGAVLALSGSSGRGKSTLARLLAQEGMNLIADDLLVVHLDHGTPEVAVGGEKFLRTWVATQAPTLADQRCIQTEALAQVMEGTRLPLRQILFPCRKDLPTAAIQVEPLGRTAGLLLLLENSFAELGIREVWRHLWDANCRIVATTSMAQALLPEGLAALQTAVIDYTRRMKSYSAGSASPGASQA